jgi:hypothetical protein
VQSSVLACWLGFGQAGLSSLFAPVSLGTHTSDGLHQSHRSKSTLPPHGDIYLIIRPENMASASKAINKMLQETKSGLT